MRPPKVRRMRPIKGHNAKPRHKGHGRGKSAKVIYAKAGCTSVALSNIVVT